MELNEFIVKALDVPFVDRGRDYSGWDCWGMVCCGFKDVLRIELPSHDTDYTDAGRSISSLDHLRKLIDAGRTPWVKVDKPEPMNVILLKMAGRPVHVGLMVTHRAFLHAEHKVGTVIERTSSMQWKDRIEGIYQWNG